MSDKLFVSEDDLDAVQLTVGNAAVDRDSDPDDPGVVIVMEIYPRRADSHEIPELDEQTVADVNPEYPRGDPVVAVAYTESLDHTIGSDRWRGWPGGRPLPRNILDHCDEWSLPVEMYDFPATRLADLGPHDRYTEPAGLQSAAQERLESTEG